MLARRGASAIARPSGALVNHLAALMRVDATRDLRPSLLAATLHAAAAAGFQQWVSSGSDDDPAVSVAAALDLVIVGVGAFDALLPKRRNRQ